MDINTLIVQQTEHLKKISEVVGTPVNIFDGMGHKNFFGANKTVYYISNLHKKGQLVQDRIRFNGQEIVIDPDYDDWLKVKESGDKIIDLLNKEKIPFMLQFSGRCIRISIFVKDKIIYYAKKKHIEPQQMCFYVYQYLCKLIGINWQDFGVPENKSKNHLLGCIGKKNLKTGLYATWINDLLPSKRFETKQSNVQFPDKIETWDVSDDFLDKAYDYSSKIPEQEVQETLSRTKYQTNEILLKKDNKYNIRSLGDILKNGIKKPEWNVENLVTKRGITIIGGIAGSLKTWFGMDMAMCCATGTLFLDHFETAKCDVLYFDEENGDITTPYRFDKLRRGHDLQIDELNNINISIFNNIKLDTNDTVSTLRLLIEEFKPKLVIIDSMVRCMVGEEDKAKDVSMVFDNLKDVFKDYKELSFVILHHTTKVGRGLMSLRGSGDFAAFADVVLMLNKSTKGFVNVEMAKNRHINMELLPGFGFQIIDTEDADSNETVNLSFTDVQTANLDKIALCVKSLSEWFENNNIRKFKTSQVQEEMQKLAHKRTNIGLALKNMVEDNKLFCPKQGTYVVNTPTEIVEE